MSDFSTVGYECIANNVKTTDFPGASYLKTESKHDNILGVGSPGNGMFKREDEAVHAIVSTFARSVKQRINFFSTLYSGWRIK